MTSLQSPVSSVRALSKRVVQPPICRSTYPSPLPSAASAGAADTSTECSAISTSRAFSHSWDTCSGGSSNGRSRRGMTPSTFSIT